MLLAVLAGVVAVAAAIRSTWSPCGQSMLSTLTPMGEASRGNRFRTTATWFILGATLGGVVLGLGAVMFLMFFKVKRKALVFIFVLPALFARTLPCSTRTPLSASTPASATSI